MNGDIRPPKRPKTNTPKPKAHPKHLPGLDPDMPLPDLTIELNDKPRPIRRKTKFYHRFMNFKPFKHWYNLNKTEKLMAGGGALLILLAISYSIYALWPSSSPPPSKKVAHKTIVKPNTVASPLSGLQVDPALAARPVTAIMIENSVPARPQSGLQDAGVVFEAIAEAGITRFMALYQDTRPQYVGPVRSLRPYYIDFALPFDASIAHVGGSPDALSQIRSGLAVDLDQFFNAGAYWRQPTRDAPHNVYTSFANLDALNQAKGHTASHFSGWPRKADQPSKNPAAKTIDLNISSSSYNVHYDYDVTTNTYQRSEGGAPHMVTTSADDNSAVRLHPKVVIGLVASLANGELDASGAYYSNYTVSGEGTAYIFQDGGVTQATWSKADRSSPFVFKDNTGNSVALDAGQTWVTIASDSGQIQYSP